MAERKPQTPSTIESRLSEERTFPPNPDFVAQANMAEVELGLGGPVEAGVLEGGEQVGLVRQRRGLRVDPAVDGDGHQVELELLAGTNVRDTAGLLTASDGIAHGGRPALIATGCTLADTPAGQVETVLCANGLMTRIATPRLPIRPCGTGDLLSGLVAAHVAKGTDVETALRRAVEGTYRVLERTLKAGADEMCLSPMAAQVATQPG